MIRILFSLLLSIAVTAPALAGGAGLANKALYGQKYGTFRPHGPYNIFA